MTVFSPLLDVHLHVDSPALPTDESRAEARSIVEEVLAALGERLSAAGFLWRYKEVRPG
jgi:hypothetical protein